MADDAIEFASLMCSRLCHDLLSPVGSFGNGLELLADESDPEMRQNCVDLLHASSQSATGKLIFFRLSFGSASGYGDIIAVKDMLDAVRGLVSAGRATELAWIGEATSLPKPAARVLLLLAQVVVEALVRGGRIDMAAEERDGALEIAVRGAGDRVVVKPVTEAAFTGEGVASAETVGIALARRIATGRGGDVMISRPSPSEIVVGAILPG